MHSKITPCLLVLSKAICLWTHLTNPTKHQTNISQCIILYKKCAHFCYKMVHCGILFIMHHFLTEMYAHVHISVTKWCIVRCRTGALWDMGLVPCGICATDLLWGVYEPSQICKASIPMLSLPARKCKRYVNHNFDIEDEYIFQRTWQHDIQTKNSSMFSFTTNLNNKNA